MGFVDGEEPSLVEEAVGGTMTYYEPQFNEEVHFMEGDKQLSCLVRGSFLGLGGQKMLVLIDPHTKLMYAKAASAFQKPERKITLAKGGEH